MWVPRGHSPLGIPPLSHEPTMDPPPPLLLSTAAHEAADAGELAFREAFVLLRAQLDPPFSLSIPSPQDYSRLNLALAFTVLTDPCHRRAHLVHLHAAVTDGYRLFASALVNLSHTSFPRLLAGPRTQLLWACDQLLQVAAFGADSLVISLLRHIPAGDFTDSNLWLCAELLNVLYRNWVWLLDEPNVLTSALFVFLRLLADHHRLSGDSKLEELKRMEVEFCVKALRNCFGSCLRIGRDLVRLLQDLVSIPQFRELWKDLLFAPGKFGVNGFEDISVLYRARTPSRYLLLRITPGMETQLRFLLTHVKFGEQKRYQLWFAKKHLSLPASEAAMADIVRFICCAHHPSNETIQSGVIARWAVVGWFLKSCRRSYFEANAKLALFYDWLFFDETADNIMNIEPAMLLMVNSVLQYVEITNTLLEFLFLLVDNYDVQRKGVLVQGVSSAFKALVKKGVVHSFEPLVSSELVSPLLREKLAAFLPALNAAATTKASHGVAMSSQELPPESSS